jgi:glutamate-ammonia-ligase adenylyltransferase
MDDIALPTALPQALHSEVLALAERFVAAAGALGVDVELSPELLRVFAISSFVAECAIREPREFLAITADTTVAEARTVPAYRELVSAALEPCEDLGAAQPALRVLRRREMARIAWRDIHLGVAVDVIMAELSSFADAVVATSVCWLHRQLAPRFGRALNSDGNPLELLVIAMGKLGGGELNFSSDIDLIFVYGGAGTTVGGRREVSHQDYFDRLGREFIALLNEVTADGYVFRVDMRLRPFGDSGPLSTSLDGLEHYYAVHGRDWERYALIKARPVSGDDAVRQGFEAMRQAFVYRRYLDFGALDALREMKQMIDREARSKELQHDIKRGPGGIREIEFTGQLFQLIRGGREPRLRQRALLPTLEACAALSLLEDAEVEMLQASYRFARVTEHRLQQVHDWQTHALPDDEANRARLAYAFGHANWADYLDALDAQRTPTRALFVEMLAEPETAATDDVLRAWRELWLQEAGDGVDARARGLLNDAQLEVLNDLKSARFLNRLSSAGRQRLDQLMPILLERMHTQSVSDAGFLRVARLLHNIARRSVYIAFLNDNPDALTRLLELFDVSPWIADQIIAQPLLLDELLDHRRLFEPPNSADLRASVEHQVRPGDGLEQAMESLRAFRNQQVLRVAASDITEHFPTAEVSNQLTYIAEACLEAALKLARHELNGRFGQPMCGLGREAREAGFSIIGYGKLGGFELGYSSDLDLVFIHDSAGDAQLTSGPKQIENEVYFTRLAQRLIHILSTATATGTAYEIDTRLRPSGGAGMLVCSANAFATYLTSEAWVWEHQALVRARAVAGDKGVRQSFADIRERVLGSKRERATLNHEITDMRRRMLSERDRGNADHFDLKHGAGGVTDIEFMVQYAVLCNACDYPSLLTWTDNLRLLESIAGSKLMPAEACQRLHDAYFVYRAAIHRCSLQQLESLVDSAKFELHRQQVAEIWDSVFG